MPYAEARDGTKLFYKDWGTGAPIVLIHGWPVNADMWEYQAPTLAAAGFRVIAYDRRGFGRSEQPWSGYDYDTLTDDLKSVMDAAKLDDATLVGFSMGGGEVARYFSRHGGAGVSKAVFVASVVPYLLKGPSNPDGVDVSTFDQMVDGLKDDRPHFLTGFGKQFYGAGLVNFTVSSEILMWAQSLALMASPKATVDCVRAFSETDFRADLATIDVPTLFIHGSADKTVPIEKSSEIAQRMVHGSVLKVYDSAPHGLFFTDKERLTRDLIDFAGGRAVPLSPVSPTNV